MQYTSQNSYHNSCIQMPNSEQLRRTTTMKRFNQKVNVSFLPACGTAKEIAKFAEVIIAYTAYCTA